MTDDFKKYLLDYKKSPEGKKRLLERDKFRSNLLLTLFFGFIISVIFPALFLIWIPFLIFILIYSAREWIG